MKSPLYYPPTLQPESPDNSWQGKSMTPPPFGFSDGLGLMGPQPGNFSPASSITEESEAKANAQAAHDQRNAETLERVQAMHDRYKYGPAAEEALPGVPDGWKWMKFAEGFNGEFATVLHVFQSGAVQGDKDPSMVGKDKQSGAALEAEQLTKLFSPKQRDLLLGYLETKTIPERLFNGDDQGGLNAQQRILLSAKILADGKYSPGSFEQEVHAKNCGHWVQTVQHYAGVTTNHGPNSDSLNGNFDLFGNVVMGAAMDKPEGKTDERVKVGELPMEEGTDVGPIDYDSEHFGKVEQYEEAMAEWENTPAVDGKKPKKPIEPFRSTHLPMEEFGKIQPGDWLYIYNANGSGNHSVIFSHWASKEKKYNPNEKEEAIQSSESEETFQTDLVKNPNIIRYQEAVLFDQGSPASGGKTREVNLGNQYYKGKEPKDKGFSVSPVTMMSKVNADARPAKAIDELLPTAKNEDAIKEGNAKYLQTIQKKYNVDEATIRKWMVAENKEAIEKLGDRLTESQRIMLAGSNTIETALETLIRLTSRLRQLRTNATVLAEGDEKQYAGRENLKYAALEEELKAMNAKIDAKTAPLKVKLEELKDELATIEQKIVENKYLELIATSKAERNRLKAERDRLKAVFEKTKKGRAEYREANKAWAAERDHLKELKALYEPHEADIKAAKKKIAKQEALIAKAEKPLRELEATLPFGQVALASKKGQNNASQKPGSNGKLANLMNDEEIKLRLEAEQQEAEKTQE